MKFQKGESRPANAGRKKGSLNKRKVAKVADFLAEKGINPAEEILNLIESEALRPADALSAWLDLLSYCQAKPKEIEADFDEQSDELADTPTEALLKLVKNNNEAK